MTRWIAANTLADLAAEVGAAPNVVKTFIATHRGNGNIDKVMDFISLNPGASDAEIVTATQISSDTVGYILVLLRYTNNIDPF
jgi:hypothetical protein